MTQELTSFQIRGRLARASRKDSGISTAEVAELRRDFHAAKIAEFVEAELKVAHPLSAEQMDRIVRALNSTQKGVR